MKKALVILLACAMIFSAFADEPAFTGSVAEFKGDASVTWTADLDAEKTGFTNAASADLKVELVPAGDKVTSGDGVWGEIKIKTDGLIFKNGAWDKDGTASVDSAKIHFGDAYLGITAGDAQVGDLKIVEAINEEKDGKEHMVAAVGTDKVTQGIVLGYANDIFGIDLDLRSMPAAAGADTFIFTPLDYTGSSVPADKEVVFVPTFGEKTGDGKKTIKELFGNEVAALLDTGSWGCFKKVKTDGAKASDVTNDYAFAAQIDIKAVENLTLNGGISYDISTASEGNMGIFGKVAYDLALNDTFYVKPQFGITFAGKNDFTKKASAGLFLGWNKSEGNGGKLFNETEVQFSNGFSVATDFEIKDGAGIPLDISVYDAASLVEGLTFGALFDIPNLKANEFYADIYGKVAYDFAAGAGKITAKAEFGSDTDFDVLRLDSGLDFAGYVDNTTFSLGYKTADLGDVKGSISVSAKIAF